MCSTFAFKLAGSDAVAGVPCWQTLAASCASAPLDAPAPVAAPLEVVLAGVELVVAPAALLGAGVELLGAGVGLL